MQRFYRKGYFKTDEEERTAKALILLDYVEAVQRMTILGYEVTNGKKEILADIIVTENEIERLKNIVRRLGFNPNNPTFL